MASYGFFALPMFVLSLAIVLAAGVPLQTGRNALRTELYGPTSAGILDGYVDERDASRGPADSDDANGRSRFLDERAGSRPRETASRVAGSTVDETPTVVSGWIYPRVDELRRSRSTLERFGKRNIDEIDRTAFDNFFKRNLDEIDRVGWSGFVKRLDEFLLNRISAFERRGGYGEPSE